MATHEAYARVVAQRDKLARELVLLRRPEEGLDLAALVEENRLLREEIARLKAQVAEEWRCKEEWRKTAEALEAFNSTFLALRCQTIRDDKPGAPVCGGEPVLGFCAECADEHAAKVRERMAASDNSQGLRKPATGHHILCTGGETHTGGCFDRHGTLLNDPPAAQPSEVKDREP